MKSDPECIVYLTPFFYHSVIVLHFLLDLNLKGKSCVQEIKASPFSSLFFNFPYLKASVINTNVCSFF